MTELVSNMSITTVAPDCRDRVHDAWGVKERIRYQQGLLKQPKDFFYRVFTRGTAHLAVSNGKTVGFAIVERTGYMSFLAVIPEEQGQGIGSLLMQRVLERRDNVTLHTRATNGKAVGFYQSIGFEIKKSVGEYYDDDTVAYFLEYNSKTQDG